MSQVTVVKLKQLREGIHGVDEKDNVYFTFLADKKESKVILKNAEQTPKTKLTEEQKNKIKNEIKLIISKCIFINNTEYEIEIGEECFGDYECLSEFPFSMEIEAKLPDNCGKLFLKCKNLQNLELTNVCTNNIINMHKMFYGCSNLKKLKWGDKVDTSNVTNMSYMFHNCGLETLDLSKFHTSEVTDISNMFSFRDNSLNDGNNISFEETNPLKELTISKDFIIPNKNDDIFNNCNNLIIYSIVNDEKDLNNTFDSSLILLIRKFYKGKVWLHFERHIRDKQNTKELSEIDIAIGNVFLYPSGILEGEFLNLLYFKVIRFIDLDFVEVSPKTYYIGRDYHGYISNKIKMTKIKDGKCNELSNDKIENIQEFITDEKSLNVPRIVTNVKRINSEIQPQLKEVKVYIQVKDGGIDLTKEEGEYPLIVESIDKIEEVYLDRKHIFGNFLTMSFHANVVIPKGHKLVFK